MNTHGDGHKRERNEDGVLTGDFRTSKPPYRCMKEGKAIGRGICPLLQSATKEPCLYEGRPHYNLQVHHMCLRRKCKITLLLETPFILIFALPHTMKICRGLCSACAHWSMLHGDPDWWKLCFLVASWGSFQTTLSCPSQTLSHGCRGECSEAGQYPDIRTIDFS